MVSTFVGYVYTSSTSEIEGKGKRVEQTLITNSSEVHHRRYVHRRVGRRSSPRSRVLAPGSTPCVMRPCGMPLRPLPIPQSQTTYCILNAVLLNTIGRALSTHQRDSSPVRSCGDSTHHAGQHSQTAVHHVSALTAARGGPGRGGGAEGGLV